MTGMNRITTNGIILLIGLAFGFIIASQLTSSQVITQHVTQTIYSGSTQPQILEYCFSPNGNCDQVLIKYINQARSSIHIMIYEFTLKSIESSLVDARNRGIEIKLVMDRSESMSHSSLYPDLKQRGFDVKIANVAGIMHDKVAIIDGQYVIEGSFNYSNAAVTSNAENLVVINDAIISQAYQNQFQQLYDRGSN
jgi:phosphatidylserine/phosphatidylglycerophosphate/cardiolipin synthase-like enzyme